MKSILGMALIIFLVGCGSDPKSLASGEALQSLIVKDDVVSTSQKALKFEGLTASFPASQCNIWITLEEPNDQLLGKLGLVIHGTEAEALDLNLYRLKDGLFYSPEDIAGENGEWTLVGLASDTSENPNDLAALKTAGQLEAFFLLRLVSNFDVNLFVSALEQSLASDQIDDVASLNVVRSSFYEMIHFNHYDNSTCEGFQLTGIEQVEFDHGSHSHEEESEERHNDEHDHEEHDQH